MKRFFLRLLSACLLMSFAGGCASKQQVVKKETATPLIKIDQPAPVPDTPFIADGKIINAIVAFVNDDIVTLYEVNHDAQPVIRENERKGMALDEAQRGKIRHAALDSLVEKKLVEQKIRELNIKVGEEEIQQAVDDVKRQNGLSQEAFVKALEAQGMSYELYRAQLREQLERLRLVSMEVRSRIQVGESEIRSYYDANLEKYREEDTFQARHIFFKINEKMPPEDIKRIMNTALSVLAEAKGGKDFAELAKTYSEDPTAKSNGGDLGSFKKGDMQPELEQTILTMKPGEVSELVYTPLGFHLVKLEERINGKPKPFANFKSEIEDTLYRKKSEERFNKWAKELRGKANIETRELPGIL